MTLFEKIKEILDGFGIAYKIIEHDPVYTSAQAAKIRDVDISMGAKALVMKADKKPVLVVVPGDRKVNFRKFKQEFAVKDLSLATPNEVKELTTVEIGAVPPLGKAMGLVSYYDLSFNLREKVAFSAGSHTTSIIMAAKDLLDVEKPQIADIT